jgi:hypothetical protein
MKTKIRDGRKMRKEAEDSEAEGDKKTKPLLFISSLYRPM